jgi:hypothetical protein
MISDDNNTYKKRVHAWRLAAEVMADLRAKELPRTDTVAGLQSLLPAFEASVRERKLSETSGLIRQQEIFSRFGKS